MNWYLIVLILSVIVASFAQIPNPQNAMAIIKIFENAPVNGAFFNLSFCIVLILSVIVASFAQILLKKGAMQTYSSPINELPHC